MYEPAGDCDETVVSTGALGTQLADQLADGGPDQPVVFLKQLVQPDRRRIGLATKPSRTATPAGGAVAFARHWAP